MSTFRRILDNSDAAILLRVLGDFAHALLLIVDGKMSILGLSECTKQFLLGIVE